MSTALGQEHTTVARLDLFRIAEALEDLRAAYEEQPQLWRRLRREPLNADVTRRLMEGYRYVDQLLTSDIDLFGYGNSKHLLELNHLVLLGTSPATRAQAATHMEGTLGSFYGQGEGGIGDFVDWYQRNQTGPAETLAAGCYLQMVSTPQLFIEGNQRTALLLCTYVLVRGSLTPFIVTRHNFQAFSRLSDEIKAVGRKGFFGGFHLRRLRRRFVELYHQYSDPDFLDR